MNSKKSSHPPIDSEIHFLSGDEPLLLQEARDAIRKHAEKQGYSHYQILYADTHFDWNELIHITQNYDLFSERMIIDLRNPSAKFDKKAQEILTQYFDAPNPDILLIISCGKLSAAQKKTKWFTLLETKTKISLFWPINKHELPQWIAQRLKKYGLTGNAEGLHLLTELTEGNLLATAQAVEKLALLYPKQHITRPEIESVMSDSARFNVFDLSNHALAGNTERVIRILQGLQHEGSEATLISWVLARDIRELYHLNYEPMTQQWASRKQLLQQAVKRVPLKTLSDLLQQLYKADKIIKGVDTGDPWQLLTHIAINLSGAKHDTAIRRHI